MLWRWLLLGARTLHFRKFRSRIYKAVMSERSIQRLAMRSNTRENRHSNDSALIDMQSPCQRHQDRPSIASQSIEPAMSENIVKRLRGNKLMKKMLSRLMQLVVFRSVDSKHVKEEWEKGENEQGRKEKGSYLFVKLSKLYFLIELSLLLVNVLMIWFVSVQSAFNVQESFSALPSIWQTVAVLDIFITLNTARVLEGREIKNRWLILKMYLRGEMPIDLLCVGSIILQNGTDSQQVSEVAYLVLVAVLLVKARWKYNNLQPFIDHNFAKQHITLVTSFAFLIAMGHVFAVSFYLVGSRPDIPQNWLRYSRLEHADWATRYLFSLYWAFTTMVTVGYGDITPQNKYEVSLVIVVQILGTSIFGYMINIIGMTLSQMKARDQALQKQLTIADKISKCFSIKDDLTYRLKNFLQNNHKADTSFSLQDEMRLIEKLNPVLKQELLEQTNSKVMKKSIFFLTQFTKALQNKLSLRLKKKILQPSEPLLQYFGEESIYIIDQGCIDVSIVKNNKNKLYSKRVKSICMKSSDGVSINVYGYTALVTGRKVNISATSTAFTIAYELKRSDLLQAISNQIHDCQALYELRDRYLQTERLQFIEVPELRNPREHFYPHRTVLMRRNNKKHWQSRTHYIRRDNRSSANSSTSNNLQVAQPDQLDCSIGCRNSLNIASLLDVVEGALVQKLDDFQSMRSYYKYMVSSNVQNVMHRFNRNQRKKRGSMTLNRRNQRESDTLRD